MRQTLSPEVAKVLKRLHYPPDVILLCVRWYSAYPLSLRHLEEMMWELLPTTRLCIAGTSNCCQSWRRHPDVPSARLEELANGRDLYQS